MRVYSDFLGLLIGTLMLKYVHLLLWCNIMAAGWQHLNILKRFPICGSRGSINNYRQFPAKKCARSCICLEQERCLLSTAMIFVFLLCICFQLVFAGVRNNLLDLTLIYSVFMGLSRTSHSAGFVSIFNTEARYLSSFMSTREHIVRHKAHFHKHMSAFKKLERDKTIVILRVLNSIRTLLSLTQPFDLRQHMAELRVHFMIVMPQNVW